MRGVIIAWILIAVICAIPAVTTLAPQQQQVTEDAASSTMPTSITIATVALRGYSAKPLLEGLRGAGEWTGRVLVITDDLNAARTLEDDYQAEVVPVKLSAAATALDAKLYKTTVLSHLRAVGLRHANATTPVPSPENDSGVLFIDADIEVNGPILDFLRSSSVGRLSCTAFFLPERFLYRLKRGHRWNSGLFFARNSQSARVLLASWADELRKDPTQRFDQSALMTSIQQQRRDPKEGYSSMLCPLDATQVTFVPSVANVLRGGRSRSTFIHWSTSSTKTELRAQQSRRRRGVESAEKGTSDGVLPRDGTPSRSVERSLTHLLRQVGQLRGAKPPRVRPTQRLDE